VGVKAPGTPDVDVAGARVPRDYRGPDQAFLLKGHEGRIRKGWIVGPPDALIEIRSPGDETYEKFPFYHTLGVPELIVIHRDTKAVELYTRGESEYERVAAEPDGSVTSRVLDTVFRTEAGKSGKPPVLRLRRRRFPARKGVV
ncbi:MAG: Uma2 family endonuclease, partial [Planctomycetes bacterium]|nr:Uma2 family endonuclease [Planctomycetota bacterium]